ncbi:MAG TPA: DUF4476 domain-containing protein [Bacteroidia bacterium]|nr:DUF4476 domain-containing protein [Bacteroidia bacterium]
MKTYVKLSIIAALAVLPAAVNAMSSEIRLSASDNSKFVLKFDNSFFQTPSNTYEVTMIEPGMHHIVMRHATTTQYGACGMPSVVFDGWVNIPENEKIDAVALNEHLLRFNSMIPITQGYGYGGHGHDGGDYYGNNNGTNGGYNNGNGNYGTGNSGCGNSYTNYGSNSGYGWNPQTYYAMSPNDFQVLKNTVSNQSFDSDKLIIAKQAVNMNHLSSQQAYELVQLMTFESTKVELAKYAYGRTVDPGNYYLVNNAFTFSSSVSDLATYINNYHA